MNTSYCWRVTYETARVHILEPHTTNISENFIGHNDVGKTPLIVQ